jgi:MFS family permease
MLTPGPQPTAGGFRALLHNQAFLRLWIGQIISQLADKIFMVLLLEFVKSGQYQVPGILAYSPNSQNSAVMVVNTLPAVVLGLAAGVYVDRWCKRNVMSSSNILRGLLVLLIPLLPKVFFWLLVVAFFESILTQFFAPAEQAAIPLVVPEPCLMAANALFVTTTMGSLVVGFAVGDPTLSWAETWGPFGQEILVGGLYILAGLILLTFPRESKKQRAQGPVLHPWQELQEGFQYLKKNRLIGNAILQLTMLQCVFAALTVLAVSLAAVISQAANIQGFGFGFLLAAAGVGLILGAGLLGQWGHSLHGKPLPLIGFLSMAAVLAGFAFATKIWLGLSLSLLLGLGASLIGVPMQTLIQQQTPESMRGRIFGLQNNVVNIALIIPLAMAGLFTDIAIALVNLVKRQLVERDWLSEVASQGIDSNAMGLRIVFLGMSLIVALSGVWAWKNTRKVLEDVL